jgi:hypothetical protein
VDNYSDSAIITRVGLSVGFRLRALRALDEDQRPIDGAQNFRAGYDIAQQILRVRVVEIYLQPGTQKNLHISGGNMVLKILTRKIYATLMNYIDFFVVR